MSSRKRILGLSVFVIALLMIWGCSSSDRVFNKPTDAASSLIAQYFPLDPGYTTVYQVTSSGVPQSRSITVSTEVTIGNARANRWIVNTNGATDTSYLVLRDSALYFLETANAQPEKILSLPFTPGASWARFGNYDVTGYGTGDLGTDIGSGYTDPLGGKDSLPGDGGGGSASKNYPTDGANTCTVVGIESVEVGALGSFSGAVKIQNIGNGGSTNFYWYVPGVGLVKYQLGTNASGTITPAVEGVLEAHS